MERLQERFGLTDKTALVTGGTKGIGWAICDELGAMGCHIITCARDATELENSIANWSKKGYRITGIVADCSSQADREKLVDFVRQTFGVDRGLDM